MKTKKIKLALFLAATLVFQSVGNSSLAQDRGDQNVEELSSENESTIVKTIDGIEVTLASEMLFEGSSLMSITFSNTLDRQVIFSWSVQLSNGMIRKGKDITLASGEELKISDILELKGDQTVGNSVINLNIK